jgi:hypothetical protein
MGAVAKSYIRKGFLIYEEMRKYLVIIYEEAVSHIWLCTRRSLLDFLIYEENFVFIFYQCIPILIYADELGLGISDKKIIPRKTE